MLGSLSPPAESNKTPNRWGKDLAEPASSACRKHAHKGEERERLGRSTGRLSSTAGVKPARGIPHTESAHDADQDRARPLQPVSLELTSQSCVRAWETVSQTELREGRAAGGASGRCQLQDGFASPMLLGAARQEGQEEARREHGQDASEAKNILQRQEQEGSRG